MKVKKYINERLESRKTLLFGVIDPDLSDEKASTELATAFYEGGADAIVIGGSTGVQGTELDTFVKTISEQIEIPIILFPGNLGNITKYADAIYYMSLMNSDYTYWISGAQAIAAPIIKKLGLEPLPTAYLVLEPGETVGWVGRARPLPRKKPELIYSYSLAAKYLGKQYVILESGSGAPEPAPLDVIRMVASTGLTTIIAGGVKTKKQIEDISKAGGNIIHIGTIVEKAENKVEKVKELVKVLE